MKTILYVLLLMVVLPSLALSKEPVKPFSVDTMQVLKIAPQDGRAVIKMPDGKTQIIKVGDPIGDRAKVIEISKDRVIFEETKDKEIEKVIIRLENGKQRIERIRKTGDKLPQLYAPPMKETSK